MTIQYDFEELPIYRHGHRFGLFSGCAFIAASGEVEELWLDDHDKKNQFLKLHDKCPETFDADLFKALAAALRRECGPHIAEKIESYNRAGLSSHYDWKRKNAAEMAS